MKAAFFLSCWLSLLLPWSAPAQAVEPRQLTVSRADLFERLIADLSPTDAASVWQRYRPNLKLMRISRNGHEPRVTDSLLTATTAADQLTLFKNKYKTMLLGGKFTSAKMSFAGMRVGVSQDVFCRTLRLKPGYATYVIRDGQEELLQLTFSFTNGKLS